MPFKIYRQDDGYKVTFLVDVSHYRGVKMGLPEMGFEWIDGWPGCWSTENEDLAWKLSEYFGMPIIMGPRPVKSK